MALRVLIADDHPLLRHGLRGVLEAAGVTVVAALAPNVAVFFAARAVGGALNAFFTPILLAALAESTPAGRLGEVVGVYAGFQSFGSLLAPLVGGLAADVNWRLAFLLVAAVSLTLSARSTASTEAPSAAASWLVARPIPLPAPVMMSRFPSSIPMV